MTGQSPVGGPGVGCQQAGAAVMQSGAVIDATRAAMAIGSRMPARRSRDRAGWVPSGPAVAVGGHGVWSSWAQAWPPDIRSRKQLHDIA